MYSRSLIAGGTLVLALATFDCSTAADPPANLAGSAGEIANAGSGATAGSGLGGGGASSAGASGAPLAAGADSGGAPSGGSAGSSGSAPVGVAGMAGSAGAPPVVDTTLAGTWDGALLLFPCGSTGSGYDCTQPASVNCKKYDAQNNPTLSTLPSSNGQPTQWTMGGTPGTVYSVTFRIRGVVEVNTFAGGTRAAGNESVLTKPRNLFQSGGEAPKNGDPTFDYNVFELSVTPAVSGASNLYFLNSVTNGQNPHENGSPTNHRSFDIDYSATIKVPGGGKVSLRVTDSNCIQIQNCGDSSGGSNCMPRKVQLDGATPAAPTFAQPLTSGQSYGQWVFFDVTSVSVAQ